MAINVVKLDTMPVLKKRLKVAAYARVSTGKEAMLESLANQTEHYTKLINDNPEWEFAGVYSDEAITGTKDTRDGFDHLIEDASKGLIDLIIVKAISRFARNTLVLLETVRKLKAINVDVYFEEQNIHSLSNEGEMVLTFLGTLAQEESRSVSENLKWRIRNNYRQGILWGGARPYGYRVIDKKYTIIPKEAKIVKKIFKWYADGLSMGKIADELNKLKLKPLVSIEWNRTTIQSILSNINYTGDLLLQKTFVENHLTKKIIRNTGQVEQYYVEEDHEAIISKDLFNEVQRIRKERASHFNCPSVKNGKHELAGKIFCGICGDKYYHRETKYSTKWICNTYKQKGKSHCSSKCLPDEELKRLVSEVTNNNYNLIQKIIVNKNNEVIFYLSDGRIISKIWNDYSRKNSWTDEMKEQARQRTINNGTKFKGGNKNGKGNNNTIKD